MGPSSRNADTAPVSFVDPLLPIDSQTLTLGFKCNNRCEMCLVEGMRNVATGLGPDRFKRLVDEDRISRAFSRLIISGAEATLDDHLIDCVRYARDSGAFRHIRIQSNGRRFADADFLDACIDAGIDEFYISVRAHEADLDERITRTRGAFSESAKGLANLAARNATIITNTPVISTNVEHLSAIVDFIVGFHPARVEFYGFVPTNESQLHLMVAATEVQRHLLPAIDRLEPGVQSYGVAWMPRCLLGRHRDRFMPTFPTTVIQDEFWVAFPRFVCLYHRVCRHYPGCEGLPIPYIDRFGWDHASLRPDPFTDEAGPEVRESTSEPRSDGAPARRLDARPWLDLLAGPDGRPMNRTDEWKLLRIRATDQMVVFDFALEGGTDVKVVIQPRIASAPFDMQTHSFNVRFFHADNTPRPEPILDLFQATIAAILARNDDGRLTLVMQ